MRLERTVVIVGAALTASVNVAEVLPLKFPSPPYLAVTECDPTASEETLSWALLPETVALPNEVEPSKKVTLPVALVPLTDGVTVAVNVTTEPNFAGF